MIGPKAFYPYEPELVLPAVSEVERNFVAEIDAILSSAALPHEQKVSAIVDLIYERERVRWGEVKS